MIMNEKYSDKLLFIHVSLLLWVFYTMQGGWQEQKGKGKKKQASQKEDENDGENNRDSFGESSDMKENRFVLFSGCHILSTPIRCCYPFSHYPDSPT